MTDIEIAHKCALKSISEIAAAAGIGEAYVEPYGRHKAKISLDLLREKAAAEVESRGLSVRQTETLVASLLRQAEQPEKEEKKPPVVDYVREAEKALSDALGRGVKFQGGQKKGRIALEFYSADDREALMEALRHMDKPWKKK